MNQLLPNVLCFSATDPSGGAGLQADILTVASLGCLPLSAVTAITIQDTIGVEALLPIEAQWLTDQARMILEDMPVHAFKLGVLGSIDNIAAVAEIVADYPAVPLIIDPVFASGRGDEFATEEMIEAMRELLLPQATLLTPNIFEARLLAQTHGEENLTQDECAGRILLMGAQCVLITGAHENTPQVVNTLYGASGVLRKDSWARLPFSYHGSGCTLASAIAAHFARGSQLEEAVALAQEYTWNTLDSAFRPGMGQHIPDRLFGMRRR